MGKVLDLIIKIALISALVFIIYCLTLGREFGLQQVHKIMGMYYVYEGDKAYKVNNMQEAVNAYKTGLDLFPNHYEAWLNLGNIYVAYEDYYSATQAYQNAILAKDNYTLARMNLGIITAEKLGNFDDAIAQYKAIISANSNKQSEIDNKAIAYYNMGHAYSQKALFLPAKEIEKKKELISNAIYAYENAAQIIPRNYDIDYNLALSYHMLGDYRKAGQYYCKAIDVEPMHYEAHYNLGLMLKHLNESSYAVDELEKAAVLSTGKYSNHTNYIFDILNEFSTISIQKGEENNLKNNKKDEPIIYVNGKITATDEGEQVIIDNFRKCNSKEFFESNG